MGVIEQMQQDIRSILTNTNDFGVTVTLTAPTSPVTTLTTVATVKKHHTTYDEYGNKARTKANTINATVDVSMLALNAADYPYRDIEERVTMQGHLVTWTDVSGTFTYEIKQWYPNEVTANLVLELGYYDGGN